MTTQKMIRFYQGLLIYTLLVILWGAWVRISHSGDGCGTSWPLCHDVLIPQDADKKTWTEFVHRAMSGLYGLVVIAGFFLMLKWKSRPSKAWFWAKLTLFFMVTEALLGAKLVIFGLVGSNDSFWRLSSMALHFMNSMLLVLSTTQTYLHLKYESKKRVASPFGESIHQRWQKRAPLIGIGALLLIGLTGAVAALANTLFPTGGLIEGFLQDLDPSAHFLIRWRGIHPLLGLTIGIGLTLFFYILSESVKPSELALKEACYRIAILCGAVVLAGTSMLLLSSPIWLKVLHLALVYALWISVIHSVHFMRYQTQSRLSSKAL